MTREELLAAYADGERCFTGANLSGADLSRADLSRADLSGADLSGADLRWASLSGADLHGSKGLMFAQCAFSDHGECGRMLTAALIGDEDVYFCGCFRGSADDLQKYIDDGKSEHKATRQIAFDFVKSQMERMVQQ